MVNKRMAAEEFLARYEHMLRYDDGKLFWTVDRGPNGRPGQEAGSVWQRDRPADRCYRRIKIGRVSYAVHHVVFVLHHRRWASPEIDHRDGNTLNNRIENLREVTKVQNAKNQFRDRRNKSGCSGVSWVESAKRWRAWITLDGKWTHLGNFKSREDAVAARKEAERREGYSERHGSLREQT